MKLAKGNINEVLVIRLQRGDDMVEGIKKACEMNGVKNAVVISMVGSLDGAQFACPHIDPHDKSGISQSTITLESPAQLLTAQGEVCHHENGELSVHLHATFVDSKGNAHGGHIKGEGNKVLNTLNVFIGVIDGVDMGFEWDEELGEMQFYPKKI